MDTDQHLTSNVNALPEPLNRVVRPDDLIPRTLATRKTIHHHEVMTIDGKNAAAAPSTSGGLVLYPHAAVWLDHVHAVIVFVAPDEHRIVRLKSERDDTRLHRKSGIPGSGRTPVDTDFFDKVARELAAHASDVLVAGPGSAKNEFRHSVEKRQPALAARIIEVTTLDHPSDGELLDYARREFRRIDQLGLGNT